MFRRLVWVLTPIVAAAACGGRSLEVGMREGGSPSPDPGAGSSASAGAPGGEASSDAGSPAPRVCDTVGQRRDATPAENAQYCVCEQLVSRVGGAQPTSSPLWTCYGPSLSAPRPGPFCTGSYGNPGNGDGSCSVNWSSCSDGQAYSFTCIDHVCNCVVQGSPVSFPVENRDTCPVSKSDLNALCGWSLR